MRQAITPTLAEHLVTAALAATDSSPASSSGHDIQPWRFQLDQDVLRVFADRERALRFGDATGRDLHMATGAALYNMRLVAAHLGYTAVVRSRPDRDDPTLLATLRLGGPRVATLAEQAQHQALWLRHGNRYHYRDTPIPLRVVTELAEAAQVEGAELTMLTRDQAWHVLRMAWRVERRLALGPEHRAAPARRTDADEFAWWTSENRRDGTPAPGFGPRPAARRVPTRDFDVPAPGHSRVTAHFESRPQLFALWTRHDEPADWLRAGQALQHVLLVASANMLSGCFLYQPLRFPEPVRDRLADGRADFPYPQIILRLGYATPAGRSPRRPAAHVLETA
ncbi:Dinucleotide-utilizing enzymes involved in molybdopterin and thiamine biosynthesis family 2 [Carbonactinospora thermoautotrophica]|uniref:Dinucleotide-utilizing enzymes involved in molybdopterin and thiamine biosynthesis family 2 n=2 Tax=Carbonactinospora thermoautotrophica TaxID=1469144 RepID=A0A132MLQ6_9ACTN|nr:hypothetical protein [Carbonactinospora thermoautotrophica]KWW98794.1 Dinucleotide-utilizing enzymes involved in molybdopterin and thiamine biosynthesis family 2 [Carbonactinospora thermoautotrophica]